MNIYVIRHGQTELNKQRRMLTIQDIELNQTGILQALEAKKCIDEINYDVIISSPLKRCAKTAQIVTSENKNIIYDNRLIEKNAGVLNGLSLDEMDYDSYWDYDRDIKYEGAETIHDLLVRVNSFLNEILEKYQGKNILLVTHNGVCRAIKCYFCGIPEDKNLQSLGQENCEIKVYET